LARRSVIDNIARGSSVVNGDRGIRGVSAPTWSSLDD